MDTKPVRGTFRAGAACLAILILLASCGGARRGLGAEDRGKKKHRATVSARLAPDEASQAFAWEETQRLSLTVGTRPPAKNGNLKAEARSVGSATATSATAFKQGTKGLASARSPYAISPPSVLSASSPSTLSVSLSGQSSTLSAGGGMTLTANPSHSPDCFSWYVDGNLVVGHSASSYTVNAAALAEGIHSVAVIVRKNGAFATASCSFVVR